MVPRHYVCPRVDSLQLKGDLSDPAWQQAPWTEDFVDILGDKAPKPRFRTRVKMLYDAENLYIGAELEEPHVWATLTEHDSVIFHDNDFEIFLDPDGDHHLYAEFEINAFNTFWDLLLVKPYRDHGPAVNGYEIKGIRTAVHVDGTINDPSDTDRGWTVEVALPFKALAEIARTASPPNVGDVWRINFSRVQWVTDVVDGRYVKRKGLPEDNWVWTPQHVVDMHQPEHWGFLIFGEGAPPDDSARQALAHFYHQMHAKRRELGRWPTREELPESVDKRIEIETTTHLFEGRLGGWRIDDESRFLSG